MLRGVLHELPRALSRGNGSPLTSPLLKRLGTNTYTSVGQIFHILLPLPACTSPGVRFRQEQPTGGCEKTDRRRERSTDASEDYPERHKGEYNRAVGRDIRRNCKGDLLAVGPGDR